MTPVLVNWAKIHRLRKSRQQRSCKDTTPMLSIQPRQTDEAKPRRWFRFSLRTLFVVVTIVCVWVAFQVSWIRQRQKLLAEDQAISNVLTNYVSGVTSDELEPIGSTKIDQLWLTLFGQPSVEACCVFYKEYPYRETDAKDIPKVRRARQLFPEARVIAVFVFEEAARMTNDDSSADVESMISD